MPIEEKVVFTVDGKNFDTRKEAENYERRQAVIGYLDSQVYWRDCSPEEIMDKLVERKEDVIAYLKEL